MPRILILTASMGDGHNTAARNVADALKLERPDAEVVVADPYTRTNPVVNRLMQSGYTTAINKYPRAWKVVFELLSRPGVVEGMSPMLAELTNAVKDMIAEFRPDVVASTYPIFSYLIKKIRKRDAGMKTPFFTIITDSTMINSAWYRWECDGFLVADRQTGDVLRRDGVNPAIVHELGFPVNKAFETLSPAEEPTGGVWKALFFPGGRVEHAISVIQELATVPQLEVSVVTGRRQRVYQRIKDSGLPANTRLIGWTDQMPQEMTSHHIFIGKAGGATVQEAISAQLPFLVSHVVPGQEEGNIALIERSGIGALAVGAPWRIKDIVLGATANNGALWRAWRENLARLKKDSASRAISRFLLERVS